MNRDVEQSRQEQRLQLHAVLFRLGLLERAWSSPLPRTADYRSNIRVQSRSVIGLRLKSLGCTRQIMNKVQLSKIES